MSSPTFRFGNWKAARLAESLARAIEEHGCPNSFAPGELAARNTVQIERSVRRDVYGTPIAGPTTRPSRATDYGQNWDRIINVMSRAGYEVGYDLNARRFRVERAPGFAADGGPA